MSFQDTLITISVLLIIFLIAYTRIKNQNLNDTLNEIKEILTSKKEEVEDVRLY
jgi:hypothetical protein